VTDIGFNKTVDFLYGDNQSEVFQPLTANIGLEKTAGYSEELQQYVNSLKPASGKTYALVNALSAGEYFGENRNRDYFPEKALQQYHKTFEALGHIYEHHVNKDPRRALGKVSFSHYNNMMKRVELILELIESKAQHIIKRLHAGELPAVSMGCRVPFDVCSICGNKAKTRAQYCHHLTKKMGHVYPNGQKVYAINTMPKFFDISIVTIPADKTASFISELLTSSGSRRSIRLNDFNQRDSAAVRLQKVAELSSVADIKKKIDVEVTAIDKDPKNLILESQKRLSKDQLEKLSKFPLSATLSTMLGLRIVPTKEDFQKLALYASGHKKLAIQLEEQNIVFDSDDEAKDLTDVGLNNYNKKIAEVLKEDIPNMSLTKPLIVKRGIAYIQKTAVDNSTPYTTGQTKDRSLIGKMFFGQKEEPTLTPHRNPIVPLGILGALYKGYVKIFNNSTTGFRKFLRIHPWLLPVLVGAGTATSLGAQQLVFNKTAGWVDRFVASSLLTVPASYFAAGVQEDKAIKGKPISRFENFVRKHPLIMGVTSAGVIGKGTHKVKKLFKTAELISRMSQENLDIIYKELIY
jgi:hypothetical protein